MKLREHKGKYIGYDGDGRVVIISSDKNIVLKHLKERENNDRK